MERPLDPEHQRIADEYTDMIRSRIAEAAGRNLLLTPIEEDES